MAKKKSRATDASRKRRTREHVLEDLSIHHVEGLVLRCGFSIERIGADYGMDLWMQTYNQNGEIENDNIWLQLKAAESLQKYQLCDDECFSYPVSTKDLRFWTGSTMPVFLILYDAELHEAYWINVNEAVGERSEIKGTHMRLRVPRCNVLGVQTIKLMREHKNALEN